MFPLNLLSNTLLWYDIARLKHGSRMTMPLTLGLCMLVRACYTTYIRMVTLGDESEFQTRKSRLSLAINPSFLFTSLVFSHTYVILPVTPVQLYLLYIDNNVEMYCTKYKQRTGHA